MFSIKNQQILTHLVYYYINILFVSPQCISSESFIKTNSTI